MKKLNSIAELRPDLAQQFDLDANFPLTAINTSVNSKRKVGWVCKQGHKWSNSPQHRNRSKRADCPICTDRIVVPGVNDLFTLCPQLEEEWNAKKNVDIDPRTLPRSSNRKVWWICSHGHEWKTATSHRTSINNPTNCPYCEGQKPIPGKTDLASQRPDLVEEWLDDKNAPLSPDQVSVGSGKRVYWKCRQGHIWTTSVSHRTNSKQPTNCPYCNRRKAIPGVSDLATLRPDLMTQWDWELNVDLNPTLLRPNSGKKAHWKCRKGHQWQATILSRNRKNLNDTKSQGCPYCYGRYAIPGETDLETTYPQIAKEWDKEKNGNLKPSTVSAASNRSVYWVCDQGHEWEAVIASRTCGGNNCPICNRRKPDVGKNDLHTLRPDISLDWDTPGNNGLSPQDFRVGSAYIAAWQCHTCGTKWKKAISARTTGNKCPNCGGRKLGD